LTVVLDASAGVELLLRSAAGQRVAAATSSSNLWVPEHFYAEAGAARRRLTALSVLTPDQASACVDRLLALPAHRVQVRPLLSEAWTLRDNVTIADALYVVLARHLDAPLITLDTRLAAAPGIAIAVEVP
jgi:predicted nucleic acid-binding protein